MKDSLKVLSIISCLVFPSFSAKALNIPCKKNKQNYKACMAAQAYKYASTVQGALKYLMVDCGKKKYRSSCFYLGNYFYKKQKYKQAVSAYEVICLNDQSSQCFNLGVTLSRIGEKARSESILSKVCKKSGHQRACALSAKYLQDISENEELVEHLNNACDGGDGESCLRMANFYEEKENPDEEEANRFYVAGCESGSVYACMNLAGYYESVGDVETSKKFQERACQSGHRQSCSNMKPKSLNDLIHKMNDGELFFNEKAAIKATKQSSDVVEFSELED